VQGVELQETVRVRLGAEDTVSVTFGESSSGLSHGGGTRRVRMIGDGATWRSAHTVAQLRDNPSRYGWVGLGSRGG